MFNKGTEDPFVCFSGEEIFVHDDLCFFHCKNPPVIEFIIQKTIILSIILSFHQTYVIAFLRKHPDFSRNFHLSVYSAALHFS